MAKKNSYSSAPDLFTMPAASAAVPVAYPKESHTKVPVASPTGNRKAIVTCEDCLHAMLHRYGDNPLLASCSKKPQPNDTRFPFVVEVARSPRLCAAYTHDARQKHIEVRERKNILGKNFFSK